MIDAKLVDSEPSTPRSTPEGSDDDEDDGEGGMTEVRFAPDDKSKIQAMFNYMSTCQALHPDPEGAEAVEEEEENEDENEMFEDADESNGGNNGVAPMEES